MNNVRFMLMPVIALALVVIPVGAIQFTFTTIDVPGATSTQAHGINPRGDIVGTYEAGGIRHGFLLHEGAFTAIAVRVRGISLRTASAVWISKCRCGPVELPLFPTSAMTSPARTRWPTSTNTPSGYMCTYQL